MKVKIQVVIESEDGRVQDVEEVACLKRGTLTAEELGLNLAEAKQILHSVQQSLTNQQILEYTAACLPCPDCGRKRPQKGHHAIIVRTLFGKLTLNSVRLYQCDCQLAASQTFKSAGGTVAGTDGTGAVVFGGEMVLTIVVRHDLGPVAGGVADRRGSQCDHPPQ